MSNDINICEGENVHNNDDDCSYDNENNNFKLWMMMMRITT